MGKLVDSRSDGTKDGNTSSCCRFFTIILSCVISGSKYMDNEGILTFVVMENINSDSFNTVIRQPFVHLVQHGLGGRAEHHVQ